METHQLKRIIIIVLALVNLALLALLGRNEWQQRSAEQETLLQLRTLYASHGVELAVDRLPAAERAVSAVAVSDAARERRLAEALLGGAVTAQDSGSATLYSGENGTLRFRRNSFFELSLSRPFLSCDEAAALLEGLGYPLSDGGGDSLRLAQTLERTVVAGGCVTLGFTDGLLSAASGYYVCGAQEQKSASLCAAADALSAFLQYVQESGLVCGSVQSIAPAWQLSAETLFQSALLPVWLIETDAAFYCVNAAGSRISPLFEAQS